MKMEHGMNIYENESWWDRMWDDGFPASAGGLWFDLKTGWTWESCLKTDGIVVSYIR